MATMACCWWRALVAGVLLLVAVAAHQPPHADADDALQALDELDGLGETRKHLFSQLDSMVEDAVFGNDDLADLPSLSPTASPSPSPFGDAEQFMHHITQRLYAIGVTSPEQREGARALFTAATSAQLNDAIQRFSSSFSPSQLAQLQTLSTELSNADLAAQDAGHAPLLPQLAALLSPIALPGAANSTRASDTGNGVVGGEKLLPQHVAQAVLAGLAVTTEQEGGKADEQAGVFLLEEEEGEGEARVEERVREFTVFALASSLATQANTHMTIEQKLQAAQRVMAAALGVDASSLPTLSLPQLRAAKQMLSGLKHDGDARHVDAFAATLSDHQQRLAAQAGQAAAATQPRAVLDGVLGLLGKANNGAIAEGAVRAVGAASSAEEGEGEVGGEEGVNPVRALGEMLGGKEVQALFSEMTRFAKATVPNPTSEQVHAATQVLATQGDARQDALGLFVASLQPSQAQALASMQADIQQRTLNALQVARASTHVSNEAQTLVQVGLSVGDAALDAEFRDFVPLVEQVVVVGGVVLPGLRAREEGVLMGELGEEKVVETVTKGGRRGGSSGDQCDSMVCALESVGGVLGAFSGYNPVELMGNVVGHESMRVVANDVLQLVVSFPSLSTDQAIAAQRATLSLGLSLSDQTAALSDFTRTLMPDQASALRATQSTVVDALRAGMGGAGNQPSAAFVHELQAQERRMQARRDGSEHEEHLKRTFSNFLPLLDNFVVAAVAIPANDAHQANRPATSLSDDAIAQSLQAASERAFASPSSPSSSASPVLGVDALALLGTQQLTHALYSPVSLALSLMTAEERDALFANVTACVRAVGDLTDEQAASAHDAALSLSQPLGDAHKRTKAFTALLSASQRAALQTTRKAVLEVVMAHMTGPDGGLSSEFARVLDLEVARLHYMGDHTHTDERSPNPPIPESSFEVHKSEHELEGEEAQTHAAVALGFVSGDGPFVYFLPLVDQVLVYAFAVLPGLKAKELGVPRASLSEETIALAIASAAEGRDVAAAQESPDLVDALVRLGHVMARDGGVDALAMVVNAMGRERARTELVQDLVGLGVGFVEFDDDRLMAAAQQVVMHVGQGTRTQQAAVDAFTAALPATALAQLHTHQQRAINAILAALLTPSGLPTAAFLAQVESTLASRTHTTPSPFAASDRVQADAQALLSVRAESPSRLQAFLPLVGQALVYVGVVVPGTRDGATAGDAHAVELVQWIAEAGQVPRAMADALPASESITQALLGVGDQLGHFAGFNPMQMALNLLGSEEMTDVVNTLTHFTSAFPALTPDQRTAARAVVATAGLGTDTQTAAFTTLLASLSPEQRQQVEALQSAVASKLVGVMVADDGQPSPSLVAEVKAQTHKLDAPASLGVFAPFVSQAAESARAKAEERGLREEALVQAYMLVQGADVVASLPVGGAMASPLRLQYLLPLMGQVLVLGGVGAPAVAAKGAKTSVRALDDASLVQALTSIGRNQTSPLPPTSPAPSPASSSHLVWALTALGDVMGRGSGYNPVTLLTNVVGADEMVGVVDELVGFARRFPELSPLQMEAAERALLSAGLGYEAQEKALQDFVATLSHDQRDKLDDMQAHLMQRVLGKLITPSGEPTPELVREVKAQLAKVEANNASPDVVPQELRDLVNATTPSTNATTTSSTPSAWRLEEQARVQSLLVLRDATAGSFADLLPLVSNVVAFMGVGKDVGAGKAGGAARAVQGEVLLQTVAQCGVSSVSSVEGAKASLAKLGEAVQHTARYNPVEMLRRLIGDDEMERVVDTLSHFAVQFGRLTPDQVDAANEFVRSSAGGVEDQQAALASFLPHLTPHQADLVRVTQQQLLAKLAAAMVGPDGTPSARLVEQLQHEMRRMEDEVETDEHWADTRQLATNEAPNANTNTNGGGEAGKHDQGRGKGQGEAEAKRLARLASLETETLLQTVGGSRAGLDDEDEDSEGEANERHTENIWVG